MGIDHARLRREEGREQDGGSSLRPGPGPAPVDRSTARLLELQATAGNRAVSTALLAPGGGAQRHAPVQRQPQPSGGRPTSQGGAVAGNTAPGGATDGDDLATVLAEIERSMRFAERVAPYEVISGTTVGQFSEGELEHAIEGLWRRERLDFTAAARRAAGMAPRGTAARPTASARLQADRRYQHRRSLNLLAEDYRTGDDLPAVGDIARRGSPYQRAQRQEFGETTVVRNPTAAQMETAIFNGVLRMWEALTPGEVGELVVTFSGHGGAGRLFGVDWADVGPDRLEELARFAADHDVHVVYVLDTCRAGTVVDWGQAASLSALGRQLASVPADARRSLLARHTYLKDLLSGTLDVGDQAFVLGDRARTERRRSTDANRLAYTQAVLAVTRETIELGSWLDGTAVPERLPALDVVRERQRALGWSAIGGAAGRASEVEPLLADVAALLDAVNDVLNVALPNLDRDIRAAAAAQRTGGSGERGRGSAGAGSAGAGR